MAAHYHDIALIIRDLYMMTVQNSGTPDQDIIDNIACAVQTSRFVEFYLGRDMDLDTAKNQDLVLTVKGMITAKANLLLRPVPRSDHTSTAILSLYRQMWKDITAFGRGMTPPAYAHRIKVVQSDASHAQTTIASNALSELLYLAEFLEEHTAEEIVDNETNSIALRRMLESMARANAAMYQQPRVEELWARREIEDIWVGMNRYAIMLLPLEYSLSAA